jgi:SAM-dependent methyltransferase
VNEWLYPLVCPVCSGPLAEAGRALRCRRGHSFDVSREGYINLLAGRRRRVHGDTKEMLRARRAFLDRGHYAPLVAAIEERARRHLAGAGRRHDGSRPACVAEAGCGEGTYVGRVQQTLGTARCFGVDVSKEAARLAAKRHRNVRFLVADVNERMPFADGSICLLLDVFAPRNGREFGRVLAPGGSLLVAIPAPDHLAELREALGMLGMEERKQQRLVETLASTFEPVGDERIAHEMDLDGTDVENLVRMTPSAWHATPETWERARAIGRVRTAASFALVEFRRQEP